MISIDIFSDPICPWCYIGKTWFDRALEASPELNFQIKWKPFFLNPDMPIEGMDRKEYLVQKFGGVDGARAAYAPIIKTVQQHKMDLRFERIRITPNTINAQRLIYWAHIEGIQSRMVSNLFKAYFKDGKNIGDTSVLSGIATTCGMRKEVVNRLLSSNEDIDKVKQLDFSARNLGIKAVPLFIIDNTYVICGAQKLTFWQTIFLEILENQRNIR